MKHETLNFKLNIAVKAPAKSADQRPNPNKKRKIKAGETKFLETTQAHKKCDLPEIGKSRKPKGDPGPPIDED